MDVLKMGLNILEDTEALVSLRARCYCAGLVIEEGEEGDLRVRQHSVTQDVTALPLDVSLNVTTEQQQNLIESGLLDSQVNGGIETQVRELGKS
jgi:hypothetical protein